MSELQSTRPSRRELRLAREAQLRDEGATQVIDIVELPQAVQPEEDPAPKVSRVKGFLRRPFVKQPALVAVLGTVTAASMVVGVVSNGWYSATAVHGVPTLATASVATPAPTVPDSLKKTEGAADSARYRGFEAAYGGAVIQCELRGGANSLASAFEDGSNVVVNPMAEGTYRPTSPYGWRIDPISYVPSFHLGQDLTAPAGTPIYSMADGEVLYAGEGIEGRSSNVIVIAHEINGEKYTSWYVHMYDDGVHVAKGDKVKVGQHIADVGSLGWSTGPHLHFEVHTGHEIHTETDDNVLDPMLALKELGAVDLSEIC